MSPLCSLLLGAHLLLFSGTACLLLRTLHFSLLLTSHLLLRLTLRHFLSPLCSLLLGTHLLLFGGTTCLLLSALRFSFLLTSHLLLRLTLRHFLGAPFRFLLGAHLLYLGGLAGGLLLLTLHGGGFSLLPYPICFRSGSLVGGHAFSGSALLLGRHILLLLCSGSGGLLACLFSLGGGLVGGHALLLSGHLLLLLRSGSGSLLTCLFSLGGGLVGGHALLLGGKRFLLRCGGLHAAFFRFGACCRLLSSLFFCHGTFLHCLLLALLHGGAMGSLTGCVHASSFSLSGSSGSTWLSRPFFCGHGLL